MNHRLVRILFIVGLIHSICRTGFSQSYEQIPSPQAFFGFHPGADRMLFTYEQLVDYLKKIDDLSDRIKMQEIGQSPMGRKMYICFISSEGNIKNLDKLRQINQKLALDNKMTESERDKLAKDGKVFVLATLSMHSGEVGPSQAAPLVAYDLATTIDPQKLHWLTNVVYMLVPCHNPDGMDMVVENYNKYKNTKYEGSSMPGVYHKYVGHDNNRDFVTLSQEDTKAIAAIYNLTWFPQVMVEKHQMGYLGPRYYVPPSHDPIAENIEAGIWNWSGIFGANLIKHMTADGLAGISQHYLFDDYWPGSTETCIWKNVIGFLTECASARYASPIYIEPNELRVGGKGLSEYKKSVNMPEVWPGGWWRLSDIVAYELSSTYSIIETAALYKEKILAFRNEICRREVERGLNQAPYYYIFPRRQHDSSELVDLINLLREQGVRVYTLDKQIEIAAKVYSRGDIIVPLAQPFRPFIKEVLEKQAYPVRHYTPGGEIIRPYDITTWSLPLHRGVDVIQFENRSSILEENLKPIEEIFELKEPMPESTLAALFTVNFNESFKAAFKALQQNMKVARTREDMELAGTKVPAGSFLISGSSNELEKLVGELHVSPHYLKEKPAVLSSPVTMPRIALVETYFHDMDAGWTRFIFDQYGISYKVIHPGEFKDLKFGRSYDLVIFPDTDKNILMEGRYKSDDDYYISDYPPAYTKGIGKEGLENLLNFMNEGGLIIAWGRSTALFKGPLALAADDEEKKEDFQLPFDDISPALKKEGLFFPGSLVAIHLLAEHPLTFGLPEQIGVFFRGRPVFTTSIPDFDMDRRVIATFAENNILLSGYSEKEEKLAKKTALLWLKKAKGQLVLLAFNPQFRASTQVSYKLLFNALLLPQTQSKRE